MTAIRQFQTTVRAEPLELDRALLLLAACDHEVAVEHELVRLDHLASRVTERSVDGLRSALFDDLGFAGDSVTYDAPSNSFLDEVVARRRGMPILLSALMIEVGRRIDVPLDGIGLPGHFVVRDRHRPDRYVDPFAGGAIIDAEACRARHVAAGFSVPWSDSFLEPVTSAQVVNRVISNLLAAYRRRQRRRDAATAAHLATMLPGAGPRELLTYVGALGEAGRFDRAAKTAEQLARRLDAVMARKVEGAALRYRARLN